MAGVTNTPLKWDEEGKKRYDSGIDGVVLFVEKKDKSGFEDGVAWSGATAINENPSGADSNKIYADNIEYADLVGAEEFGFSFESYQVPEEFDVCDGAQPVPTSDYEYLTAANGVRVVGHGGDRRRFALLYRVKRDGEAYVLGQSESDPYEADRQYVYHIIYGAKASPSGASHSTINQNPDAITYSYECTTNPITDASKLPTGWSKCAHFEIDAHMLKPAGLKALIDLLYSTPGESESDPAGAPKIKYPKEILAAINTALTPST